MPSVSGIHDYPPDSSRLRELMECIEEIHDFTSGLSRDDFVKNKLVYRATLKNLQIIGDCTDTILPEQRKRYPQIPWQCIASLGRKIVRSRNGVNSQMIWDMLQNEMPLLQAAVEELLAGLEDSQHHELAETQDSQDTANQAEGDSASVWAHPNRSSTIDPASPKSAQD